MKTRFRWAFTAVAGWLAVLSGSVRADDSSLGMVPAKSPIVVQVNGLEKARNRLGKFLGNALPDLAPKLAKKMEDGIAELAEGRDLKSISADERIYFVVNDLSNLTDNPQFAILLPVSSYAEFKKGFLKDDERKSIKKEDDGFDSIAITGKDEPGYMVDRKNYVVLTNDKEVAKKFAKGDDAGLAKAMSKETAKAFLDQDAAVYVNLKEINRQYGAQIRGFKLLLGPLLQQGGAGIDKKQAEMFKQMFDSFLSMLEDGVATVIGLDFRPEGVNFRFTAQFASESETNAFLKKLKPSTLAELGSLPGGKLMYSASNFDPTLSKTLSAMMKEVLADDEDEDAKKIVQEAAKEMTENGRVVELVASNALGRGLTISEYNDGAKALASLLKLYKALTKTGSLGNLPLKSKPEVKENVETVGEYKLSSIKMAFDFDKAVENLPEAGRDAAKAMMIKMAGENTNFWIEIGRASCRERVCNGV